MIVRHFAVALLTLVSFATLNACSSGKEETDAPVGDDDDDDNGADTADTAEGGGSALREIYFFSLRAEFGYDADTDSLVPVSILGTEQPPLMLFLFGTPDWDGSYEDVDEYCSVYFDMSNATVADWSADVGVWLALDYQPTAGEDDCDDFDASPLGGDLTGLMSSLVWSIGVGGELSPALAGQIDAEYLPLYAGGYVDAELLAVPSPDAYTFALAVDEDFEVLVDDAGLGTSLENTEMHNGLGGLNTAFYRWNANFAFQQ